MENLQIALKRDRMPQSEKIKFSNKLQILYEMTPFLDMTQNADLLLRKLSSQEFTIGLDADGTSCLADMLTLVERVSEKDLWAYQSMYVYILLLRNYTFSYKFLI